MDVAKGMKTAIVFDFYKNAQDKNSQIIQILMHEIYVIVVFEASINIFNAQSGAFLEERGVLENFKYKYRAASLNHQTGDVILIAHSNSTTKNVIQTVVYQLKEIPAQDQIDYLLNSCRINEANEIFMLKGNKGGGDFNLKSNKFFLDVGWIRLTKMLDFDGVLNDFKNTEMDPRELILMYKNLLVHNIDSLKKHFNKTDFQFDLKNIVDNLKLEESEFIGGKRSVPTDTIISDSKKIVCQILENKNQKFTATLKNNPTRSISFLYSKFSPFSGYIKADSKVQGVPLRDVVAFIQTNLIKLYVEQGDKKAIYNFF
jgi:hypothetical protein